MDIERGFAQGFVSNPHSGEVIKGHAVVLAHLGLAAYVGKVVRDVGIFDPPWTRERRAAHIICRLAFMREYFARADVHEVVLYRGLATDGRLRAHSDTSFVSATFDREVAESIVSGGPTTRTAVLYRQVVSTERLFMTHLETAAMSRHYRESEAVLLADPGNLAF